MRGASTLLGGVGLWAPYVKNLMRETPGLIAKNDELKATVAFVSREDHARARTILDARIEACELRLADQDAGRPSTWKHAESPEEAWRVVRFGTRPALATGSRNRYVPESAIEVDDSQIDEGLAIRVTLPCVDPEDGRVRLRVRLRDVEAVLFHASLAGRKGPIVFAALVELEYVNGSPPARDFVKSLFGPALEAEEAGATLFVDASLCELRLDGFTFVWER